MNNVRGTFGVIGVQLALIGCQLPFGSEENADLLEGNGSRRFVISDPADVEVGNGTTVSIEVQEAKGGLVSTFQDDVQLVASGSAYGDGRVDIVNGIGQLTLYSETSETVVLSLVDSEGTGLDITSTQEVHFSAGEASKYGIVQPARVEVGQTGMITVQIQDQYGNGVESGTSSLTLSTSGSATLGNSGVVNITNGTGTIEVSNTVAEDVALTLTGGNSDLSLPSESTVMSFYETSATQFTFSLSSISAQSGQSVTVTIESKDSSGNRVTDYEKDIVLEGSGSGVIVGVGTVDISNGVGTASVSTTGTGSLVLSLRDSYTTGLTLPASQTVTYSAGSATRFRIVEPTIGEVGTAQTVTVQAQDSFGNLDSTYNSSVTLSSTGSATVGGGGVVTINSGTGTQTVSDTVAEKVTLSLSDSASTGLDVGGIQYLEFYLLKELGSSADDDFGTSVAYADYNGDGVSDLVIGMAGYNAGTDQGRVIVYSGSDGSTSLLAVNGTAVGDQHGYAVANLGDYDGDGKDEIAIGAPYEDDGGTADAGRVFIRSYDTGTNTDVVSGSPLRGETASDQFGAAVSGVGDVNQDGRKDMLVGAPYYDGNSGGNADSGKIYVYSGSTSTTLTTQEGENAGDLFGFSLGAAGDVNGDGYADYIVGAPYYDGAAGTNTGKIYVYSGSNYSLLFSKEGTIAGELFGWDVDSIGDLNRDGKSDVMASAPSGGTGGGVVRLISGSSALKYPILEILSESQSGANFGTSVSFAGDFDHDGYPDVIVGAPDYDTSSGTDYGKVAVYSGRTREVLYTLEGEEASGRMGYRVAGGGDTNQDGHDDFLAVEIASNSNKGQVYAYESKASSARTSGELLATKTGVTTTYEYGGELTSVGDYDGDGYDDFAVGMPKYAGTVGSNTGKVIVYSGKDRSVIFGKIGETAGDQYGYSVAGAGDYDGDGRPEIVVGAPYYDNGANADTGKIYVYSSDGGGNNAILELTLAGAASYLFGFSVAGIGDYNGDGTSEIAAGAPGYNSSTGRVYVKSYNSGSSSDDTVLQYDGGAAGNQFGYSVAGAGNYTGGATTLFVVGAPYNDDSASDAGEVKVLLYNSGDGGTSDDVTLEKGGEDADDWFGMNVKHLKDYNGDGTSEIGVGAPGSDDGGAQGGEITVLSYNSGDGGNSDTETLEIAGAAGEQYGISFASAGDFNHNGLPDLIIGLPYNDTAATNAGQVKVLTFDGTSGDTTDTEFYSSNGENASDQAGMKVGGVLDASVDGASEILFSAPAYSSSKGRVYIHKSK